MSLLDWLGLLAITALCLLAFFGARGCLKRSRDVEGRVNAAEVRIAKRVSQFNDELRK